MTYDPNQPPPYALPRTHQMPPQSPYAPPQGWVPPSPGKKANPWVIVAAILGVVVTLCGAALFGNHDDSGPSAAAAATSSSPSASPSPSARLVKMPNVVGQNAAAAEDQLQKLGFANVTTGSADGGDTWVLLAENWTVKKQSVKAGHKVLSDTLIVLMCTKLDN